MLIRIVQSISIVLIIMYCVKKYSPRKSSFALKPFLNRTGPKSLFCNLVLMEIYLGGATACLKLCFWFISGKVAIQKEDLQKYHNRDTWFQLQHVDADSEVQVRRFKKYLGKEYL